MTQSATPPRLKVLFLGNSQMSYFDVPRLVQALSESAPPGRPRVEAAASLIGGASLKTHWENRDPRLETGSWDFVVIQEIFYGADPEFSEYAAKFDALIRAAKARTLLFATANVTRHYGGRFTFPESTQRLNDMQLAFGRKDRIPVATAGHAWIRYLGENPTEAQVLDLYAPDKGHPGLKGSYLYACLLYACLTGQSPVGLARQFPDIKGGLSLAPAEAARMQQAAWEEYQATGRC